MLLEIIWGSFTPTFLISVRGKNMVLICLKKDFFFLNLSINQPFTLAPLSLSHCIHVTLVISPPLCLHPTLHFHCHVPSIPHLLCVTVNLRYLLIRPIWADFLHASFPGTSSGLLQRTFWWATLSYTSLKIQEILQRSQLTSSTSWFSNTRSKTNYKKIILLLLQLDFSFLLGATET